VTARRRPPRNGGLVVTVLGVAIAGAASGCTVGSGSGSAIGPLWVTDCNGSSNYGTPQTPEAFDLQPTFFAGEPIEDLATGATHQNRLNIRMQRTGLAIQYNDTLYFDVENSYEVARCIRGRTVNGQPDWNQREMLANNAGYVDWCDWSGTAFSDGGGDQTFATGDAGPLDAAAPPDAAAAALDGGMSVMAQYPRIHITPDTDLRSSLMLLSTCPMDNVSAEASDGWIEFTSFGSAEQPNLPPEMRTSVSTDFVINYGDRLRATFHVVLQDAQYVYDTEKNLPLMAPLVGGALDGYFDFNLDRGRAAQSFP
jgi:hypothetical protein